MNPARLSQPDLGLPGLVPGGLVPLTTTDYPGQLAAVVFCQGCPWACGYCQNPHLIPRGAAGSLTWQEVMEFLHRRQGLLDAVVFSGGEPTLQPGLDDAIREARGLGYKIGLHTGGPYPARLEKLLPLLDWVGMDIKAPFAAYDRITGAPGSGEKARASARLVLESGVESEFRTTVHSTLLSREDLRAMARELAELGVQRWVLQEFRPQGCADAVLCAQASTGFPDDALIPEVGPLFPHFSIRRG